MLRIRTCPLPPKSFCSPFEYFHSANTLTKLILLCGHNCDLSVTAGLKTEGRTIERSNYSVETNQNKMKSWLYIVTHCTYVCACEASCCSHSFCLIVLMLPALSTADDDITVDSIAMFHKLFFPCNYQWLQRHNADPYTSPCFCGKRFHSISYMYINVRAIGVVCMGRTRVCPITKGSTSLTIFPVLVYMLTLITSSSVHTTCHGPMFTVLQWPDGKCNHAYLC